MQKTILTVSELNSAAQKLLEGHFSQIWVEGEISNLSRPSSGHLYFSLKDAQAQIRCAMFRSSAQRIGFELRAGLLVQVKAKVSIYPDRGDYQLIVDHMEIAGEGLLRQAYEQLVRKLSAQGLFEEKWKKPLPHFPTHIGVITSATGAAIRDVLTVLNRRFPALNVYIYPTKVQGTQAAPEIVQAIQLANKHAACEVLILARGGGSLEDLWPFNEEIVAKAIFESNLPIVTGIGHEVDFTIADFVADKRAATPSAAAELVSPNQLEVLQRFILLEKRLKNEMQKRLNYRSQSLDNILKRLRHPSQTIQALKDRLLLQKSRLIPTIQQILKDKSRQFISMSRALETISPLATLNRGYAIVMQEKTSQVVRSITQVSKGDAVQIKFQDGDMRCYVD